MNLLAIDTFAAMLSAAVLKDNEIFYMETDTGMKHSELVMSFIDTLMTKAGLKPADLNGVLCMAGPGSFTGLRIGYSTAKGLALSLSIPFASVPTLDCVALRGQVTSDRNQADEKDLFLISIIEARKNAYFYAFFKDGIRISLDKDGELEELTNDIETKLRETDKNIIMTGPAARKAFDSLPAGIQGKMSPENEKKAYAREIITIAQKLKILDNDCSEYLYSGPDYIRVSDAELERRGKDELHY